MRFLDANVFIYAYYKPKRGLSQQERVMKELAKGIVSEVNRGREEVMTTVVHVSEIVNILKKGLSLEDLHETVMGLFMLDNVTVFGVSGGEYFAAIELGSEYRLDPNDALAIQFMKTHSLTEIYSFDKDFERVEGISRLPEISIY
ncbi:MAG: type II toxin-antitoxin system VapC family toxin [Candidatus Geothermarchaeales archaeon]